jgi:hypothetical protein
MSDNSKHQNSTAMPDYTRFRNAARASPLAGRYHPKKYTSPLDTQNLMSAKEFHKRYIGARPGNRYTDSVDIVEVPEPREVHSLVSPVSPETPVTATSATATQRSETETSLGGDTYRENEEYAPNGWYLHPTTV